MQRKPPKRTTLKDVAKAVGVNVSTVSRALDPASGHGVSPDLTEKIRKVSQKLGYQPNVAAYSLKTSRTRTIGVVVPDLADPIFPPIIRGIEDGLSAHDYVSIVVNTDNDDRREQRVLATLNARGVDGYILATPRRDDASVLKLTNGRPVVTVVRKIDDPRYPSVVHNEDEGIRLLLNHLMSLGHREIAHIAGPQNVSTGFVRYSAFEKYRKLLNADRASSLVVFARAFTEAEGERCAEELLARERPFTAIICANDRIAVGAIVALRRRGLDCPADISVAGFNDMPLADRLQPALTTIRVQHHKLGMESALLIVNALKPARDAAHPDHIELPVELVVRDSTQAVQAQPKRALAAARKPARTK